MTTLSEIWRLLEWSKILNNNFGESIPTITSIGTVACAWSDEAGVINRIVYETNDITELVEWKLGVDENTYDSYKVANFAWKAISPGFIAYK